jgi:antitoxin YefM
MSSTSYSEARRNLKSVFDRVCLDREPMLITRKNGGNVVVLAAEEFSALEETAYLLRSPANARRLLEAVARDRAGTPARSFESVAADLGLEDEALDGD